MKSPLFWSLTTLLLPLSKKGTIYLFVCLLSASPLCSIKVGTLYLLPTAIDPRAWHTVQPHSHLLNKKKKQVLRASSLVSTMSHPNISYIFLKNLISASENIHSRYLIHRLQNVSSESLIKSMESASVDISVCKLEACLFNGLHSGHQHIQ
jgi:hypothetical protein